MRIVFVLAHGQNVFFAELVDAIGTELDGLGVPWTVTHGAFPPAEADTAYVLLPPHEWYALERRLGDPDASLFPRTVFLCAEQPGTTHFDDNVNLSERAAGVLDINRHSVREFARRGVEAEHFQLGWSARWEVPPADDRDVDLLFMGCATPRRMTHLASYGSLMWRWRSRLVISDNGRPNVIGSPGFVGGEEKLKLLARSKVLLNLHQSELPYFEWLRAIEAIANRCLLVSEHSSDVAPLVPGEHLVLGRPETLGILAQRMIEDDEARQRIADAAYAHVREELPLRRAVERLVAMAERAARAPVGRLTVVPRRRVEREAVAGDALASDVYQPDLARQPPDSTHDHAVSALKAAVKEIRMDVLDLRRRLDADALEAEAGGPLPALEIDRCSSAWAAATPRVSTLTTLYNYGHHIEAALDSVATSGYRDLELIIVDDASTDDSLERARAWIERHPTVPALLLRRRLNKGLPHGRNAALAFARGEYSFVLDADNEVYPQSISRLVGALDYDRDAVFAYGMLERFDIDGPLDLIGWFPWDPVRLREGNYIDAMALLRTERITALGGYTTDRRLHGWEDYDLWCRIAEHGGHGVQVPEVLARYRASRHSMLSLTNISATIAFSVLIERYPTLMAGIRPPL